VGVVDHFTARDDHGVRTGEINVRWGRLAEIGFEARLYRLRLAHDLIAKARQFVVKVLVNRLCLRFDFAASRLLLKQNGGALLLQIVIERCLFAAQLALNAAERFLARFFINMRDNILSEVKDSVEIAAAYIEQQTEIAGYAARIPNMGDRSSQFNVTHAFAPHRSAGDLNAAFIADDAAVAHVLVFAAVALPITRGAEDRFTKKTIFFWAEPAVVDRLWLKHLAI
jgi:hypothetical protein